MMRQTLFALLISITPVLGMAQAPEPSPDRSPERPRFSRGGFAGERELEDVARFMSEYAPNRWAAMRNLPDEVKGGVMNFIVARYRSVSQLQDNDPDLYQLKLQQLTTEDEIYGIVTVTDPERRQQARDAIAAAVRKLTELNIAEREYRLARLKKEVQEEETRLAADRAEMDEQVKSRTETLISEGSAGLRRDFTRRWDRDRHRGGGQPGDGK